MTTAEPAADTGDLARMTDHTILKLDARQAEAMIAAGVTRIGTSSGLAIIGQNKQTVGTY